MCADNERGRCSCAGSIPAPLAIAAAAAARHLGAGGVPEESLSRHPRLPATINVNMIVSKGFLLIVKINDRTARGDKSNRARSRRAVTCSLLSPFLCVCVCVCLQF